MPNFSAGHNITLYWLFISIHIQKWYCFQAIKIKNLIIFIILLHEKLLKFDWLRAVVFQLNLKYLQVKITNLLWVVV